MDRVRISVVIPTYNRSQYISETLGSVFQQTISGYEVIVVDDGSTDETYQILEPLIKSGQIHYVYQENQGEAAARNHGIRLSKGEYIAFLDSDDLFLPKKLELQANFLDRHPEIPLVHSWYSKFNDSGADLGIRDTSKIVGRIYPDILLNWRVLIAVPCVMVKASVFSEVGLFDEDFSWAADLDMWRRITRVHPIGVIERVLSKIRVHPESVSANKVASVSGFENYLNKAFKDDRSLTGGFRKKANNRMYTNTAKTILSQATKEERRYVRENCSRAIDQAPYMPEPYLVWCASYLPTWLRDVLLTNYRKVRYPRIQ